jgi:5'(3')-deoxyribonucleotidase
MVTSDTMESWLKMYNRDFKDNLTVEQITSWGVQDFVKQEAREAIIEYVNHPEVFDNAKPIDGAIDSIKYLKSQGHNVIFISVNNVENIKEKWLKRYGLIENDNQLFITENKETVPCDFLVDDKPENLYDIGGIGILFTQSHNKNIDWHPRANNWKEVIDIIEGRGGIL